MREASLRQFCPYKDNSETEVDDGCDEEGETAINNGKERAIAKTANRGVLPYYHKDLVICVNELCRDLFS